MGGHSWLCSYRIGGDKVRVVPKSLSPEAAIKHFDGIQHKARAWKQQITLGLIDTDKSKPWSTTLWSILHLQPLYDIQVTSFPSLVSPGVLLLPPQKRGQTARWTVCLGQWLVISGLVSTLIHYTTEVLCDNCSDKTGHTKQNMKLCQSIQYYCKANGILVLHLPISESLPSTSKTS